MHNVEHVGLSVARPRLRIKSPSGASTCTPLENKGTFSTVEINVGTPVQKFDVVADTGSNAVIVLSCACVDSGHCNSDDKCFVGTNRSSSFSLGSLSDLSTEAGEGVPSITMSFGSGDIQAVVATDKIVVAKKETRMSDGLLLMVDKQLDFGGPFEGILGLGIPAPMQSFLQSRRASLTSQTEPPHAAMRRLDNGQAFEPPEFLSSAGVSRFSICFNDGGASGVLRLGTESMPKSLGSVGQLHWGLGMTGVSVGSSHSHVEVCSPDSMREGQMTPCGVIPDSGTTSIMAPKAHLEVLFASICDEWPRCSSEREETGMSKPSQFTQLLRDCGSWLDEHNGLAELPSLHFHITGSESGQSETLELGAWAYVLETVEEEYDLAARHLADIVPQKSTSDRSSNRVCSPAFGVMDMATQLNGDVWILGTPLFYAFNVNYNLDDSPPSIAFQDQPCGTCDDETHQELLVEGRRSDVVTSTRGPRQMRGAWRLPTIDVNGPM